MDRDSLADHLTERLMLQDVSLDRSKTEKLVDYLLLLNKWNKAYNLTAVRDPVQMITRHLIDSLTILPFLQGKRFLDVGTGAGLPGMVAAIAVPDTQWVLLDSNFKKTRFLTQAVIELGLDNVQVVHARVEDYRDPSRFDMATSRAVTRLRVLLEQVQHLCHNLLAMKGRVPDDEIEELPDNWRVTVHRLQIAGSQQEERSIILINQ